MRRKLLEILACPIDKHYPLSLHEIEVKDDIISEGVLTCTKCGRFYPIVEEIPIMLPDELRNQEEDLSFLRKWQHKLPREITHQANPVHLN
ncbi:MAG: Trm112 family protein [Thaumarchaeota archaeon]|nr:Trm112 family protein [Nitrososphaerota archaeon]